MKSQNMWALIKKKWFWPSILAQDAEADKRRRCGKRRIKH
jgi:hypothetical protein